MREGVYDGGADAKAGKGAGARHKSDCGDVGPSFLILGKFVSDEAEELFGEIVAGFPFVSLVV